VATRTRAAAETQAHYIVSMQRLLALPVRLVHVGHCLSHSDGRHRQIIRNWLAAKSRHARSRASKGKRPRWTSAT
jgi:hypothetical protein